MSQTFVLFIVRTRCYIWCLILTVLATKALRTAEKKNQIDYILIKIKSVDHKSDILAKVQTTFYCYDIDKSEFE